MKYQFFVPFLFLLFFNLSFSQKLAFSNFHELRSCSVNVAEQKLINMGFDLTKTATVKNGVEYFFETELTIPSGYEEVTLIISDKPKFNQFSYSFHGSSKHYVLMKQLNAEGFKLESIKTDENRTNKIYRLNDYVVFIGIDNKENPNLSSYIYILSLIPLK